MGHPAHCFRPAKTALRAFVAPARNGARRAAFNPRRRLGNIHSATTGPRQGSVFLQTDPIGYGDGMNWYAYTHGDPVNGIDPTGTLCYEASHSLVSDGQGGFTYTAYGPPNTDCEFNATSVPLSGAYPGLGSSRGLAPKAASQGAAAPQGKGNTKCSGAASGLLPRGAGFAVGAEGALGNQGATGGGQGITGQVQGAVMGFVGDNGPNVGTAASGGYVNTFNGSSYPSQGASTILGAFVGAGPGVTFTNARNAGQLSGSFQTINLSTFLGGVSLSFSGSTYQVTITTPGLGASLTSTNTTTFKTSTAAGHC